MSDLLDLIKGADSHHAGVRKAQELDRQKADKFLVKGGGWMPFGSKHDGLRKRNAKGGFDYWYPNQNSYKRGKATGEHSTSHTGRHDENDHKMHVGPERHDACVVHHQNKADSFAADFKGDNSHYDNMLAAEMKHHNAMRMGSEAALRGDGAEQVAMHKLADKHRKEAVSHHDAHWDEHHAKQAEVRKLDKKVIDHYRSNRGQEIKVVAHVDKNGEAQGHSVEQSWDSAKPGTSDYAGGAHSDPTVSGHSTLESAKQHALQIMSRGSSPFDRATRWSAKGEKKTGYSNTEIKQGLSGKGHANFTVQATKHLPDGRKQNVSHTFDSKAEAENWIQHAMPGNDYKKSVGDNPDLEKAKYISRKRVGGHWSYEYAKDHAEAQSKRAHAASANPKADKVQKYIEHGIANELHQYARSYSAAEHHSKHGSGSEHTRESWEQPQARGHDKHRVAHILHSDHNDESWSADDHAEAYHRLTERAKHMDEDEKGSGHKGVLHGLAFDHAAEAMDKHKEAGNEKEAARWSRNSDVAFNRMKHHNVRAGHREEGGHHHRMTEKSVSDNPDLLKAGKEKGETFGISYAPHIQSMYAGGDNE